MRILAFLAALATVGCASSTTELTLASNPADAFFQRLSALCGRSFEGRMVTSDPADSAMAGQRLTMHVRDCSADQIRIPFHVGEDRSRTWVVTRLQAQDGSRLRLKHDHRHADGTEDVLSQYGGDTEGPGSAGRQVFPADSFSKALFERQGRAASISNVWAMEIEPRGMFAYELTRPDRRFRVEFDLSRPG
jgi:hypothetical protein